MQSLFEDGLQTGKDRLVLISQSQDLREMWVPGKECTDRLQFCHTPCSVRWNNYGNFERQPVGST